MSDFGISMVTGNSDYNPIEKEYYKVHFNGPIYKAFDELNQGKKARYTSKFDVVFYGILLWKILTR